MHVSMNWARWAMFGLILLGAAEAAAAADATTAPAGAPAPEAKVYKFAAGRRLGSEGRDHLVILADAPGGGHAVRLVVPNTDADKYSPPPDIAGLVKQLQPGQLVRAETTNAHGIFTVQSLAAWAPRPGEDQPHGYIYLGQIAADRSGDVQVRLSRFGEISTARVPAEKDDKGAPQPNAEMAAELKKVQEGDVVWADLTSDKRPSLLAIVPWTEPQTGKFVHLTTADVDGQRGFAVEIETESKPVTALIRGTMQNGHWVSDVKLMSEARRFTGGSPVVFRTRDDVDKQWLLEIEPPPKQPTPTAQRNPHSSPPLGIPVRPGGGAGSVPGVGGIPGGF